MIRMKTNEVWRNGSLEHFSMKIWKESEPHYTKLKKYIYIMWEDGGENYFKLLNIKIFDTDFVGSWTIKGMPF